MHVTNQEVRESSKREGEWSVRALFLVASAGFLLWTTACGGGQTGPKDTRSPAISLSDKLQWHIVDVSPQQSPTDGGIFSSGTGGKPYGVTVSLTNVTDEPVYANIVIYGDRCDRDMRSQYEPTPPCYQIDRATEGTTKALVGPKETREIKTSAWPQDNDLYFSAKLHVGIGVDGVNGLDESGDPRTVQPE